MSRDLVRLMAWSAPLSPTWALRVARTAFRDDKAVQLAQAQQDGTVTTDFDPAFVLTVIMTLATAWTQASPFGLSLDPDAVERAPELRQSVAAAVALMVTS